MNSTTPNPDIPAYQTKMASMNPIKQDLVRNVASIIIRFRHENIPMPDIMNEVVTIIDSAIPEFAAELIATHRH